jgi:hypothetical protein
MLYRSPWTQQRTEELRALVGILHREFSAHDPEEQHLPGCNVVLWKAEYAGFDLTAFLELQGVDEVVGDTLDEDFLDGVALLSLASAHDDLDEAVIVERAESRLSAVKRCGGAAASSYLVRPAMSLESFAMLMSEMLRCDATLRARDGS